MEPAEDDVRAQLERVLASEGFAGSGRLSRLLRYLVERTLAGEAEALKEYAVGSDVFDRGADYDPRLDSIVRVEARRLRAKLDEYYRGPGVNDPITIEVPRGSYVPVFARAGALRPAETPSAEELPTEATASARPASTTRYWALAGFGLVAVVVALAAGWQTPAPLPAVADVAPVAPVAPAVRIAVLPFAPFSSEAAGILLAARITDGVTTELARLGSLSVVSRTSAAQFVSDQRPVTEVAQILDADLIMEGSAIVERGQLKVTARLVDGAMDRKVWVGEYAGATDTIADLQRRLATEAAAAALKIATLHSTR
jgi:adenylate cyclase